MTLAGHAAGTLRVEQFERLQAFFLMRWLSSALDSMSRILVRSATG